MGRCCIPLAWPVQKWATNQPLDRSSCAATREQYCSPTMCQRILHTNTQMEKQKSKNTPQLQTQIALSTLDRSKRNFSYRCAFTRSNRSRKKIKKRSSMRCESRDKLDAPPNNTMYPSNKSPKRSGLNRGQMRQKKSENSEKEKCSG